MNRIKEIRESKGIRQRELAKRLRLNGPLVSQMETHVVMPTVVDSKKLCALLECEITDLYDKADLQYIPHKNERKRVCYNLSARLPVEMGARITDEVLQKCGYATKADWLRACTRRLFAQYEIILKHEKSKEKAAHQLGVGKAAKVDDPSSRGHLNTKI